MIDSSIEPLETEYVTHIASFGSESYGAKDEYLLVSPKRIHTSPQGEVLLADEMKIKIYDQNGKGKITVGSPGQGPGEFD
ncbi:6-bladed beta-propeller, partial [candidate division KSB1 bacterium]